MTGAPVEGGLPPKLAALLASIDALRDETVGIVREAAGAGAPAAGGWSPGELLEHLLLAEVSAGKVVRKTLSKAGATLPSYPADDSGIGIRNPVAFDGMEAPGIVRPSGGLSLDALLSQAAAVRAATRETVGMLAAVDPRAAEFPHARFGPLNLYEWLAVVILEHEKAHRPQLLAAAAGSRP